MDHQLIAAIEDENHCLQKPTVGVEPESQLTRRAVLVKILDPHCPGRRLDRILAANTVLQCRVVNVYAADRCSASRMTSERDLPSRSARSSIAAISSTVSRSATT